MLYTGLNYHRSFSYVTTMNEKGEVIGQSYVSAKPLRLNREFLRYRASLIKIQTGINDKSHVTLAKNNQANILKLGQRKPFR